MAQNPFSTNLIGQKTPASYRDESLLGEDRTINTISLRPPSSEGSYGIAISEPYNPSVATTQEMINSLGGQLVGTQPLTDRDRVDMGMVPEVGVTKIIDTQPLTDRDRVDMGMVPQMDTVLIGQNPPRESVSQTAKAQQPVPDESRLTSLFKNIGNLLSKAGEGSVPAIGSITPNLSQQEGLQFGNAAVQYMTDSDRPGFKDAFAANISQPAISDSSQTAAPTPSPTPIGQGTVLAEPVSVQDFNQAAAGAINIPNISQMADDFSQRFGGQTAAPATPSLPSEVAPGSPQANFLAQREQGALSPQQIAQAEEFAKQMGTTFSPETGYSRDPFLSNQASRTSTPLPGQTLSQFMRYEDQPAQRTEQFVDPQGRLRRRMTPAASSLMGLPEGTQPLAPQYAGFEADSAARQARIGGTGSFEGDSAAREARLAARPDFMEAQRSDAGQTMTDADRRDLAKASMPGASASDIARGMKVAERTKPEPTQGTVVKYGERELIRQPDGSLKTLDPIEGPFVPSVVELEGGDRVVMLSRNHGQLIQGETKPETAQQLQDGIAKADQGKMDRASALADSLGITGKEKTALILSIIDIQPSIIQAITGITAPPKSSSTGVGIESIIAEGTPRQEFNSVEEAEAANLPAGTKIKIGGRNATVQ